MTLREEMRGQLAALNDALPGLDWLRITNRKSGAIQLTPLGPQPEPREPAAPERKRSATAGAQVPLIDMVTEAALRTGMLGQLTAVGPREALAPAVLWSGCCCSPTRTARTPGSAPSPPASTASETDLRYTARRHFTIDGARAVAIQLANATFAARQSHIWGQSTTTVASDSTHFRAYDQNLFTEWHSRYGFDLLPRIKQINKVKLYQPDRVPSTPEQELEQHGKPEPRRTGLVAQLLQLVADQREMVNDVIEAQVARHRQQPSGSCGTLVIMPAPFRCRATASDRVNAGRPRRSRGSDPPTVTQQRPLTICVTYNRERVM